MKDVEVNVFKRNGTRAPKDASKILKCIEWACKGLSVSPFSIFEAVEKAVYDGIKTTDIHRLAIGAAAGLISLDNPDANYVAARLLLQEVYKQAADSVHYPHLRSYLIHAHGFGLLDDRMIDASRFDMERLNSAVQTDRDFLFGYLGLQTLADRYFLREKPEGRIIEMPQHFWMRVAMGVALNEKHPTARAIEFYNILSTLEFVSSTPTLFNSGTCHSQLSSCYGNTVYDSISNEEGMHKHASIFGTIEECANLSKYAGGIGTDWTRVRAEGDFIRGTSGISSGVVPYLKIYNDTAVAVNQGGKRKGSFAPYLEPWHPDFLDFIELKKNTGDERKRAHEIYPAGWMPDLFMKRVKAKGVWSFFSPKQYPELHELYGDAFEARYVELEAAGKFVRQMPAVELWRKWLTMMFETGHPWVTFKDETNRRNPQGHVGVIHNSNLCVAPETLILTDKGYVQIKDVADKEISVWNGESFTYTVPKKTGEGQELLHVMLDNGAELDCTPYHKFYVQRSYHGKPVEVRAHELQAGDKLIKFDLPVIVGGEDMPLAYTSGLFSADGTYAAGKPVLSLYQEKRDLFWPIQEEVGFENITGGDEPCGYKRTLRLPDSVAPKFEVPLAASVQSRLDWFAGLCDGDGTVTRNGTNESLQVSSVQKPFLDKVRLMLHTLGIDSKVSKMRDAGKSTFLDANGDQYDQQALYRLLIASTEVQKLLDLGFKTWRLSFERRIPNREARHFAKVVSVEDLGRIDDTYCFTEQGRHMGMFNGILTGNCTEIALNNSDNETFVCNLGSINLSRCNPIKDRARFRDVVHTAMRMLDNVIDINFYPSERARNSNLKHRPVGLGVMGYMEYLVQNGIDFESQAHLDFADCLFEEWSYYAIDASCELAQERGAYPTFEGSLWSKGILPIDTARGPHAGFMDWCELRSRVVRFGMRNSNCMAIAPTATISNIAGTTPCIEAAVDLVYSKTNLSGDFLVIDPTLKYGRPELAKGMFQIDPLWVVRSAAVRQKYIDQAQSTNIFVKKGTKGKVLAEIYETAWELGLKTTYYLRTESQSVEVVPVGVAEAEVKLCSIDNSECEACQ